MAEFSIYLGIITLNKKYKYISIRSTLITNFKIKSLSQAIKLKIISLIENGYSIRDIATKTGVSKSTFGTMRKTYILL